MTISIGRNTWQEINLLARAYLELQRPRVGFDLRMQKLVESELLRAGLVVALREERINAKTGTKARATMYKPIDTTEKGKEEIDAFIKNLKGTNQIYHILKAHEKRLKKQEEDMIKDASEIFEVSEVWTWCLRTRGLGPVAALTFIGYINPERTPTLANLWSMIGLTPGSRFKKGEQGHSNPMLKGRFWVIAGNTIKAADPYYSTIYRLKKDYLSRRPDLLDQKEGPNKVKGWKGKMHNYAMRVLMKILIAHAYEIMMKEYRDVVTDWRQRQKQEQYHMANTVRHRNVIPIKPVGETEQMAILKSYKDANDRLINKLEELWDDTTDEEHRKYYDFMRNADII